MFHQINASDADDGYKKMWLKSAVDKVIEADMLSMRQCSVYGLRIMEGRTIWSKTTGG